MERLQCDIGGLSLGDEESQGIFHQANHLGGTVRGKAQGKNSTFVRIRVDHAPVPIPSCASGPGSTCPLGQFEQYIHHNLEELRHQWDKRAESAKGNYYAMDALH